MRAPRDGTPARAEAPRGRNPPRATPAPPSAPPAGGATRRSPRRGPGPAAATSERDASRVPTVAHEGDDPRGRARAVAGAPDPPGAGGHDRTAWAAPSARVRHADRGTSG